MGILSKTNAATTKNKEVKAPTEQSIVDQTHDFIDRALEANKAYVEDVASQIREQKRNVEEAEKVLNDIETLKNADAYANAISKRDASKAAVDVLMAKQKEREEQPLITATEYNDRVNALLGSYNTMRQETRAKLFELSNQMQEAGERLSAYETQVDNALRRLQVEAYKFGDCPIDPHTGKRETTLLYAKRCFSGFTYDWATRPSKTQAYKNYAMGEDEPEW